MNKLSKLISIILSAVMLITLLPIGDITHAEAAASVSITKSNLIYDGTGISAEVTIESDKEQSLYIAVAAYNLSHSELKAVETAAGKTSGGIVLEGTVLKKHSFSETIPLKNYPSDSDSKTYLYVWSGEDNITPLIVPIAFDAPGNLITSGAVSFEAEDVFITKDHGKLYTTDSSKLSGGKGVILYNQGSETTAISNGPNMQMEFYLNDPSEAGRYKLWVRASNKTESSASFFADLNSGKEILSARYYKDDMDGEYRWTSFDVYVNEGYNYINIYARTEGVFDKFIITSNLDFTPTGINDYPGYKSQEEMEADWAKLYPEPTVKPPANQHPRLYLNDKVIADMKANAQYSDYYTDYQIYTGAAVSSGFSMRDDTVESNLAAMEASTAKNNYNELLLARLMTRAFKFVMNDSSDTTLALSTVDYMIRYLNAVRTPDDRADITRERGDILVAAAIVYDWCYPVIKDDDTRKQALIDGMIKVTASKEIGWPPVLGGNMANHAGEREIFRDLLAAGIAIYDEYPLLYNLAAGRMEHLMIPARKWLRGTGTFDQGFDYGEARSYSELWADITIQRMTGSNISIYGDVGSDAIRSLIYNRLPYGSMLPVGDSFTNARAQSAINNYPGNDAIVFQIASTLYKDPYMEQEFQRRKWFSKSEWTVNEKFFFMLFDDYTSAAKPAGKIWEHDELPLSVYSSYPMSRITARTSWQEGYNAPTALAFMDMHEAYVGDHQHKYTGDFQIYYKGLLAMNTGIYNASNIHNEGYSHRAISANTMLVYKEGETFKPGWTNTTVPNDGGQRNPYEASSAVLDLEEYNLDSNGKIQNEDLIVSKDVRHYIGPNAYTPKISYIGGDLTNAYTDKVEDYERHMVFVDTNNADYPAAFIVYDKVTASDSSYKKTFLLHSQEAPTASGNKTTITRTSVNTEDVSDNFGGKLVNTTLLPENPQIKVVGDENGTMYSTTVMDTAGSRTDLIPKTDGEVRQAVESGNYRIEISAPTGSKKDTFLNAMFVTDAANSADLPMTQFSDSNFDGVSFEGNTILFNKGETNLTAPFIVDITEEGSVFIVGIAPGKWQIGDKVYTVTEEECTLYFEISESGSITVTKVSDSIAATSITYDMMPKAKIGAFGVYKSLTGNMTSSKGHMLNMPYEGWITDVNGASVVNIPLDVIKDFGASWEYNSSTNRIIISYGDKTATYQISKADFGDDYIREKDGKYYFRDNINTSGGYNFNSKIAKLLGVQFVYRKAVNCVITRTPQS